MPPEQLLPVKEMLSREPTSLPSANGVLSPHTTQRGQAGEDTCRTDRLVGGAPCLVVTCWQNQFKQKGVRGVVTPPGPKGGALSKDYCALAKKARKAGEASGRMSET